MKKVLSLLSALWLGMAAVSAKTITISWPWSDAQFTASPTYDYLSNADYFSYSYSELGSQLHLADTISYFGLKWMTVMPYEKALTPNDDACIYFRIKPRKGVTFKPTSVEFNAMRFGTNGDKIDVKLVQNSDTTTLATDVWPNRNNASFSSYSHYTYSTTSAVASDQPTILCLQIYSLDADKRAGFNGITITGETEGTPESQPELTRFNFNGTDYIVDQLFKETGENTYAATILIEHSKTLVCAQNPPLLATVDGTASVEYNLNEDMETGTAIITVTGSDDKKTVYTFTTNYKPYYKVSYYNLKGSSKGSQYVEEGQPITTFKVDYTTLPVDEGYKVRGWFTSRTGGTKVTTDYVVTDDIKLYAVASPIEEATTSNSYSYDFTLDTFYPEDHELIEINNGEYYNKHGWIFEANGEVKVQVAGDAYITLSLCPYSKGSFGVVDGAGNVLVPEGTTSTGTAEGAPYLIDYKGGPTTITVKCNAGYLHGISVDNCAANAIETNAANYYEVEAGNANHLLSILRVANGMATMKYARQYVFIPNGTYDLGTNCLTTVSSYVSLIGESRDGVIIVNHPTEESISKTATLKVTGDSVYLQDLSVKCDVSYAESTVSGRGVTLQDTGTKNIYKNVTLLGNQDTYYSSNTTTTQECYFEDAYITGTVDFICGGGNIFFNKSTMYLNARTSADNMCAPSTSADLKWGYVMRDCTIDGDAAQDGIFNIARPWQNSPALTLINTLFKIKPNENAYTSMAYGLKLRFHEYNSHTEDDTEITGHSLTKCNGDNTSDQLYIPEGMAKTYTLANVFESWTPDVICAQLTTSDVAFTKMELSWKAVDNAFAYAIVKNGSVIDIVPATTTSYTVTEENDDVYGIRVANAMGGFGDVVLSTNKPSAIEALTAPADAPTAYDLYGRKANADSKGLLILSNGEKTLR